MTRSVVPTRSAFFGPTVMVKRCSQSGSTVSPKMARGFLFGGSSSARAILAPAPSAPATRPVTVCRKCLRGKRGDCGKERRWVVLMILLDKFGTFSIHVHSQRDGERLWGSCRSPHEGYGKTGGRRERARH